MRNCQVFSIGLGELLKNCGLLLAVHTELEEKILSPSQASLSWILANWSLAGCGFGL